MKSLLIAISGVLLCVWTAKAQMSPGFQSHNFQYLTGVMTPSQTTTPTVANAFNSVFPPKFYSMSVTTTASNFLVKLEGSLDNQNWSSIAVTNSVIGVISSVVPNPMLYFRMRAATIAAGSSLTGTAIGVQ